MLQHHNIGGRSILSSNNSATTSFYLKIGLIMLAKGLVQLVNELVCAVEVNLYITRIAQYY